MIRRILTVLSLFCVLAGAAAAQEAPTDSVRPPEITVSTPPPVAGPSAPPTTAPPAMAPAAAPTEYIAAPSAAGPTSPTAPGGRPTSGTPAPAGAQQQEAPPWYTQIWPFLLIIVIFYFLLIRPQQKKAKEHQSMLKAIGKGDQVMTTGGMFGRVIGMTDQVVTLEISDRVRVKVARSYIAGKAAPDQGKVPDAPQR